MTAVVKTARAADHAKPLEDESRLVHEAQAGDAESFARLYDAYMERVYRFIYFRVSDDQTAEDITSQVFLRAWEHLSRYRLDGSFLAWLYTIARNAVIDHYRTRKPVVSIEEAIPLATDGPTLDDQAELHFEAETVRFAMQVLTEEQQQVISLKFIAGFSTEEIARKMGKRAGAIRALQMRALHALAKELETERS